jgi:HAE1 family hydrophobic/amphiphilic exporter-1
MKIIRLAVERPVTTMMFYIAVVLVGIISILMLPQEMFPTVTFPQLLVVTRYGAAAPEEIENIITKLIEEQAGTVPNLKSVRSISREGRSVVMLEFNWGTDMGLAHLSVREKIDLIKDRLPSEAEEPIVQRYNPFAQPMMILSISGDLPLVEMTRMCNDVIKKRLQKVDGVASASISGGQTREIWVEVDLGKMQASNISISGIVDSLKQSNVNYPAGSTQGRFYEYLIRTIGEFKDVQEIGRTVIAVDTARDSPEFQYKPQAQKRGGDTFQPRAQRLVPLRDIAVIKDTFREADSYSRHNGKTNISIAIQKQFDANTVKTADRILAALKEIRLSLPKEMHVDVVYDESEFITGSLFNVAMDAVCGGILAFVVLLYFLRNVKDAMIVTITLPISIIFVFIFLYFMGRSINVIALAGLSLGIGSMIDNSIAVLDNIVEYRKKFPDPKEAAIRAPEEIAVAQISSMLTNIAVFFPLMFAKGLAQQLFKDLFYAAVVSNIAALVVALTLIPRIMAYSVDKKSGEEPAESSGEDELIGVGGVRKVITVARPEPTGPRVVRWLKKVWYWLSEGLTPERSEKLESFYRKTLVWSLGNRKKIALFTCYALLGSLAIFYFKSKIFMPSVDQGQFLQKVNMPVGTRLEVTNRVVARIEKVLEEMPEIKDSMARVGAGSEDVVESLGPHQGELIVTLDREKTDELTEKVILKMNEKLKSVDLEGAEMESILQGSSMKGVGGGNAPIAITVKGPDLGVLRKESDEIQERLRSVQGISGVKTSLPLPSYETRVHIDKDRASGFGLTVSEIARAAMIAIRGFIGTYYKEEGKEVPIRVRLRAEDRTQASAVQGVAIRNNQGVMVTLGDVADVSAGYGPSQIQRIDQQRAIVVTAQVLGRSFGEVMEDVEAQIAKMKIPKDYTLEMGGTKKEMEESFGGLILAFMLAVVLIYMIMAAGFESLLHPFLIMFTVPLGVVGVALILFITFMPLSAPVFLGLVLLGGIVVCNGIVLIDQINNLRREGYALREAVVEGCVSRLKPVLMSALTTILSLIPTAMGFGQGTEITVPMAVSTLGGLLFSTTLTLIIIPTLYITVEEYRSRGTSRVKGGLAPNAG